MNISPCFIDEKTEAQIGVVLNDKATISLLVFLCVLSVLELENLGVQCLSFYKWETEAQKGEVLTQVHRRKYWQNQAQNSGLLTPKLVLVLCKDRKNKAGLGLLPGPCRRSHSQAALRVLVYSQPELLVTLVFSSLFPLFPLHLVFFVYMWCMF